MPSLLKKNILGKKQDFKESKDLRQDGVRPLDLLRPAGDLLSTHF